SSQLKRLEIIYCFGEIISGAWGDVLKKFPLLEELSLYATDILLEEYIEAAGHYCPLLKTQSTLNSLETVSNIGLKAILDGCCHLETLDLRKCLYVDLKGDMEKEYAKQIKILKLPDDSLEDCPHIHEYVGEPWNVSSDSRFNLVDSDDYHGYFDHDDYDLEDMTEVLSFMSMTEMLSFMSMFG
nr:hypothetical protein [Tanacetum cinerariifolium]